MEVMNHLPLWRFHFFCGRLASVWFCAKNAIFVWIRFFWQCQAKVWLFNGVTPAASTPWQWLSFEPTSSKLCGPSEPSKRLAMRWDCRGIWVSLAQMAYLLADFSCIVTACMSSIDRSLVVVPCWTTRRWVDDGQDWLGRRGIKFCSHVLTTGGPIKESLATVLVLSNQYHCVPSRLCNWSHHHRRITRTADHQHQLHWH